MQNTVELIGTYGSDETHALSAWTSTSRELTDEKRARIPALLKKLRAGENKHTSPFEKSSLHFLVRSEIATHIHFLKHRIAVSINAESARYKELTADSFYVPEDWPSEVKQVYTNHLYASYSMYHDIITALESHSFSRKRAKESARFVLPYANQITMDVMFNFHSFMHFQQLRNAPDAQDEIRVIAEEMLRLVRETHLFDASLAAYNH